MASPRNQLWPLNSLHRPLTTLSKSTKSAIYTIGLNWGLGVKWSPRFMIRALRWAHGWPRVVQSLKRRARSFDRRFSTKKRDCLILNSHVATTRNSEVFVLRPPSLVPWWTRVEVSPFFSAIWHHLTSRTIVVWMIWSVLRRKFDEPGGLRW